MPREFYGNDIDVCGVRRAVVLVTSIVNGARLRDQVRRPGRHPIKGTPEEWPLFAVEHP